MEEFEKSHQAQKHEECKQFSKLACFEKRA